MKTNRKDATGSYSVKLTAAKPDPKDAEIPESVWQYMKTADEKIVRHYAELMKLDADQFVAALKGDDARAPGSEYDTSDEAAMARKAKGEPPFGGKPGLKGDDLEQMQRAMGTHKSSAPKIPFTKSNGDFVMPTITPTEHRRIAATFSPGNHPAVRASAAPHGRRGLEGDDLEQMQRAMGTHKSSAPSKPYSKANGDFVLPCTPNRAGGAS